MSERIIMDNTDQYQKDNLDIQKNDQLMRELREVHIWITVRLI